MAILFLSGNEPSSNDELQISLIGLDNSLADIFNILVGTEQGPEDLKSSRLRIILLISWGFVGYIRKDCGTVGFR